MTIVKVVVRAAPGTQRRGDRTPMPMATSWKTRPSSIEFDANGQPVFQPEVVDAVEVDRSYLQVVAEGMRMVNERESDTEYFTGASPTLTGANWNGRASQPRARQVQPSTATTSLSSEAGVALRTLSSGVSLPTHAWYVAMRLTMTRRSWCLSLSSTAGKDRPGPRRLPAT